MTAGECEEIIVPMGIGGFRRMVYFVPSPAMWIPDFNGDPDYINAMDELNREFPGLFQEVRP